MTNSESHRRDGVTAMYRACVRVLTASAALLFVMSASAQPAGKGLFIEIGDNDPVGDIDDIYMNITDGTVTGVQIHVCWSHIQPSASNVFDWDELEDALIEAGTKGFKVILRVDLVGGGSAGVLDLGTYDELSTPEWLITETSATNLGGEEIVLDPNDPYPDASMRYLPYLPWYGDATYQTRVAGFAQELHDFLRGVSPYTTDYTDVIEFIRPGGWQANSNEPNFYFDYTNNGQLRENYPEWVAACKAVIYEDLKELGVKFNIDGEPLLDDTSDYSQAIQDIADVWKGTFTETGGIPIGATVNLRLTPCTADNAFIEYCRANDFYILNPGLNEKDHSMTRQAYSDWKTSTVKVGWAGITNIGEEDVDRIKAAFEAFGFDPEGEIELPACITGNEEWDALSDEYPDVANTSYVIWGMGILTT